MAKVHITNVVVFNNPNSFFSPFQFEITLECIEELEEDIECQMTYVGSADSEAYDQVLDTVHVGPLLIGRHVFVFQADPPDVTRIPEKDAVGVTIILLTCSYRGQEFVRVGYFINNEYTDSELKEIPPPMPVFDKIQRNILATKPRITRFKINWNNSNANDDMDMDDAISSEESLEEYPPQKDECDNNGENMKDTDEATDMLERLKLKEDEKKAKIYITNVVVFNNPNSFFSPFQFEFTLECIEELEEDIECQMIYVGSADSEAYDQILDTVHVGPLLVGKYVFVFQADPPDVTRIPEKDAVGITIILLTCSYRGQEFVRIGYFVDNNYTDPVLKEVPPPKPIFEKLTRNILATKPRITRFKINWDSPKTSNTFNMNVAKASNSEIFTGGECPQLMLENNNSGSMNENDKAMALEARLNENSNSFGVDY